MDASHRFHVIGFNDVIDKYRDRLCSRFKAEDCFWCDVLPSQEGLRAYATKKGYLPRKGRGISQVQCFPVYTENEGRVVTGGMLNPFKPPRAHPATAALARFLTRHL